MNKRRNFLKISILSIGFGFSLLGISHLVKNDLIFSSKDQINLNSFDSKKYFKDLSSGKFIQINGYFVTNEELKILMNDKVIK
ncbi:hypothetical protein N9434_00980 [Candidatus Pelagibacter sp.]|nr:hypothetical protein [Candidatus Pelagibacter sp.]|tara:strand:- start:972 stop:1220 length:249 start_codon:yes stop_codon:yes gene_type:complete